MTRVASVVRQLRPARLRARLQSLDGWRGAGVLVLIGGGAALGHAPLFFFPATLAGLTALVWALDGAARGARPAREGFRRAFWFGFGYFLAGAFWIALAFWNRGLAFAPLGPPAAMLLAAGLAAFWGAAGAAQAKYAGRGPERILLLAVTLFLAEWLRGHLFSGFPWNLPGHVWPAGGALSQSAALFGVWGLSLLTLFAFMAPAAALGRGRRLSRFAPLTAAFLIFAGLFADGTMRLSAAEPAFQPGVRLRFVQSALSQREKWEPGAEDRVREHYLQLTGEPGLDAVTHVLWPEGALPSWLLEDGPALNALSGLLGDGPALIAGTPRRTQGPDGETLYFNSVAVLAFPGGRPRLGGLYDKVRLVPFGEFIPFAGFFRSFGIEALSDMVDGYDAGPGAAVIDIPGAPRAAPLVCYEIAFSRFIPRGEMRPEWMINLSNDAWFGPTAGPRQHLNIARYRAIEEGLPVARAASGGVSGVIDAYGRMVMSAEPGATGAFDAPLPAPAPSTPYARYGDIGPLIMLLLAVFAFFTLQQSQYPKP